MRTCTCCWCRCGGHKIQGQVTLVLLFHIVKFGRTGNAALLKHQLPVFIEHFLFHLTGPGL
jgi:hypothetical protein